MNHDRRKFLQTTLAVAAVMSGDKELGSLQGKEGQSAEPPVPNSVTGVGTIDKLLHGAIIALKFKLDPPVSEWRLASKSPDGSHTTYAGNGYTLDLEERQLEGGDTLVDFVLRRTSGDGSPCTSTCCGARVASQVSIGSGCPCK